MAMNTATYWAMTINNPDDNDYALVTTGYPDYVRSLIHTREIGGDGTEHIQAWIKLKRQQRMSFVKKLFPRGHFTPLASDEYELNTRRYVQKNDDTTAGAHIQQFNDPVTDCITLLKKFARELRDDNEEQSRTDGKYVGDIKRWLLHREREAVVEDPYNAKVFVSPTYNKVKTLYWQEIFLHIVNKHGQESDPYGISRDEHTSTGTGTEEEASQDGSGSTGSSGDGTSVDDHTEESSQSDRSGRS
jgi:hypothetical protein